MINVYAVQDGEWSPIAIATTSATSFCLLMGVIGYGIYNKWLLKPIREAQAAQATKASSTIHSMG